MTVDLDEIEARAKSDGGSLDWLDADDVLALVGEVRRLRDQVGDMLSACDHESPCGCYVRALEVFERNEPVPAANTDALVARIRELETTVAGMHLTLAALVVRGGGEVTLTAADFERVPPGAELVGYDECDPRNMRDRVMRIRAETKR